MSDMPAISVLGRKLDSIPFSTYHIWVILVLGLVGFTDGYDLALTGSLLVLAKEPLHITPDQIRWLTVAATMFVVVGGFISAAMSDHVSRKTIIQIGVIGMTFFTLLIPFVQTLPSRLIIVRAPDRHRVYFGDHRAVPRRRGADAGPAPAYLWRDL